MGRKPTRTRQHFHFYLALLILLWGCAFFKVVTESKEARDRREANEHLQVAQNFLARGDYEESLRESQKVLNLSKDQSPADAAIFNMGLVYAHPRNPRKDNKRAIGFFSRVIKSYPESPWIEQAKIWVGVLDDAEKLKQVDIEIEEKKRDRTR